MNKNYLKKENKNRKLVLNIFKIKKMKIYQIFMIKSINQDKKLKQNKIMIKYQNYKMQIKFKMLLQ